MKVKVELRIEYNDPHNKKEYDDLIEKIKNYFENDISIPVTDEISWDQYLPVEITTDYK